MNELRQRETNDRDIVVIRRDEVHLSPSPAPIFEDGVVLSAGLPDLADALLGSAGEEVRCALVRFESPARTRFHVHSADQLLLITAGTGYVGTESRIEQVVAGDVVIIPGGLSHYHGSSLEAPMEHLTVLFGSRTDVTDGHPVWPPHVPVSE